MMLRVSPILVLKGTDGVRSSGSSHRDESPLSFPSRFVLRFRDSLGRRSRLLSPPSSLGLLLRCSRLATPSCVSDTQHSSPSASIEDLRRQLEALHLEAEEARGRANTARARFMRLTQIVDNLRMRAITDLKSGKEESARQLISEKQKIMQALEKSKHRAELLEELCNKLGEAISSKELQVMASLSSTMVEVDEDKAITANVRIVSPKTGNLASDLVAGSEDIGDTGTEDVNGRINLSNNPNLVASRPEIEADSDAREGNDWSSDSVNAMLSSTAGTYPDFLSKIDKRLHEIEVELHGFLNIAAMILPENVNKNTKERISIVRETWQDLQVARARLRNIIKQEGLEDC